MRCGLRFGLLGPPVLYDAPGDAACTASGPATRAVGSPKVRALLAVLLLDAGRVVSVESLKEALWGGAPPASAQASLHNHVARLRRLLDDPERLLTVSSGYMLRVEQGELDVDVFETHAAAARAAHAGRDWKRVVRECAAALALWRGAPLAGLPPEIGGYAFVRRLCEVRLLLLEWRYDAELALGGVRLHGVVPELAALAAEHPLREAYHRQLMLALHRTGRQAEALAVHRDLRTRLVEQLGVEPGPAIREAHVEILRGPAPDTSRATDVRDADARDGGVRDGGVGDAGVCDGGVRDGGVDDAGVRGADVRDGGRRDMDVRDGYGEDVDARDGGLCGPGLHGSDARVGGPPDSDPRDGGGRGPGPRGSDPRGSAPHDSGPPDGGSRALAPRDGDLRGAGSRGSGPHDSGPRDGDLRGAALYDGGPPASPEDPEADVVVRRTPRPAQLPPPPAHFIGRTAVRDDLHRVLAPTPTPAPATTSATAPSSATAPTTPTVAVISGMAGVGKSALALHVAHRLAGRFPDGQLYVNLHGATPGMTPLTPRQALTALLRDLGAEPRSIPEHPDGATALLRSLLAPTRTLLVLDDAANAAQVRPLLPAGAGCAVIVTSRSPLTVLDGARTFRLGPLSGEDSAALLRAVSGRDGLHPAHRLVHLTGRLPLALRVVAARLAARSALTPDVLAGQLAATEGRLHHLEYDDLSVRRSLAVAHDALAASEREADLDAALTLRRIGALDLPTYGAPLMARLTGTDERRAEAALDRLVDVALLEETAYGRYAPHDLVRDFARELAAADHGTEAVETSLRWYAAVTERAQTAIVEPGLDQTDRRRPTTAQPPEHAAHVDTVLPFATSEEAFAWGDAELQNVVALVERYADEPGTRTTAYVSTLVRLLFPYLHRSGRVAEMEVLGRTALRVARRLGDEAAEAYALGDLAGLRFLTGRQGDALALNDEALTIWRGLGTVSWIRRCLNNRGLLLEGLGRHAESGDALRQSLEYSRQLNDPYGEAVTHSHLGNLYEHTDPRAAIEQHRRSLAIGDAIGAVIVQHSAHCNIGYAHLRLGEPAAALPHFEESLRILGGPGDWHGESQTRLGLVRALRLLGRGERAARECAELLRRADARADRYTGGLARHQHGLLLRERGRVREACEEWRAALAALDGTDEQAVLQELRALLAQEEQ